MPEFNQPILILGFEGWANGDNVAVGMIHYFIQKVEATRFATLNPDHFCRFDDTRPIVRVKGGKLKEVSTPEDAFFAPHQKQTGVNVILFKDSEPHLRWCSFTELIFPLHSLILQQAVSEGVEGMGALSIPSSGDPCSAPFSNGCCIGRTHWFAHTDR
jgi:hypothetical protein